ncbi:MAG: macro domain-containing protein [Nitrososphaeria archaeon]
MEVKVNEIRVLLLNGDITDAECDAIVNAANAFLKHGGGVALAIVRKGGSIIQKESDEFVKKHGPLRKGEVAVTTAGRLRAKHIIHTVGPIYGQGSMEDLVAAYLASLRKADELGDACIAFPAISTGAYGFPMEDSALAFLEALKSFRGKSVREVRVYLYGDEAYRTFVDAFTRALETKH